MAEEEGGGGGGGGAEGGDGNCQRRLNIGEGMVD